MHNPPTRKSLPANANYADRRDRILVELRGALARQTQRRRLLRIGKYLASFACAFGALSWLVVGNSGLVPPENMLVSGNSPSHSVSSGDSASKYADVIVHSKPELLESVLLSNHDMVPRTNVSTISDEELVQLVAASSAPLVIAKIDNQLVAVPLKTKTRPLPD